MRLVDNTYRIVVFDIIIFSDSLSEDRIDYDRIDSYEYYIFLRLCGDIAMTNEDLLIQFKKLLYNECTFIHLKFEFIPKIKSLY